MSSSDYQDIIDEYKEQIPDELYRQICLLNMAKYKEENKNKKVTSDNEDSEYDYENSCDCCCLSWTDEPNEFGICHCWCSTCGDELKICRWKCLD